MVVYTKEGWLVKLGQEWVAWGWRNCLKYLKSGWNRKEGRANKDFKKGAGWVKGWCLKKWGWNPFTNNVNNKRKNMKGKTKKAWSWKCDETLFGMEEFAEAIIHKCSVNKVYFKKFLFNRVSGLETCNFNHLLLFFVKFFKRQEEVWN